jgi:hypothetical protein
MEEAEATVWRRAWDSGLCDSAWLAAWPDRGAAPPAAGAENDAGPAPGFAHPLFAVAVLLVGAFGTPPDRAKPRQRDFLQTREGST